MPRFHEYEFLQKISKFLLCLKFIDSPVAKTVEKTVENFYIIYITFIIIFMLTKTKFQH